MLIVRRSWLFAHLLAGMQASRPGTTHFKVIHSSTEKLTVKPEYFKSLLLRPLKNGDGSAGKLLQALVAQTLLRRTKDSKDAQGNRLVSLPPIEYFQVPVQLDDETRQLYDEMYEASRERFREALRTGGVSLLSFSQRRWASLIFDSEPIQRPVDAHSKCVP